LEGAEHTISFVLDNGVVPPVVDTKSYQTNILAFDGAFCNSGVLGLEVRREFWAVVTAVRFGKDAEITWVYSISDGSEGKDRLLELR